MTKFLQTDDVKWKMALVVNQGKCINPCAYYGVSHGHSIADYDLECDSVSA